MVLSQRHVAVMDPHRKCIKHKSETSPAGIKKKLSEFFKYKGHTSTFESVFDLITKVEEYDGTIFRFPLRKSGSMSEISNQVYTPEMVREKLFESLKEESPYILLFLQNIKSISLMEWTKGSSQPHQTFQVTSAMNQIVDDHAIEVGAREPRCKVFAKQCSQSSKTDDSKVYLELKSTTITVTSNNDISCPGQNWLVLNVVGTNDHELNDLGKELSIVPWVGLASRLRSQIALSNCETTTTLPFDDCTTVETVFKQLRSSLVKSQQSVKWSGESVETSPGHAYCFLPLPECTAMPVHVHGYFAVTDNRRSIKWPAHDEKGKEAQWNRELLQKMVAPAYALLLSSRASLIHYEDTPLLITNAENMTDPYSTWPLYPEVKNVPIWNELLSPTLDLALHLPLLWTSACDGELVKFSEAYFLPGSYSTNTYNCSAVVIQLLIKLKIPVVSLPTSICETLRENKHALEVVSRKEISPAFVRQEIKKPECCSHLSRVEVYDLLDYILSDLNESDYHDLVDICLLPLKGDLPMITFQKPDNHNHKYIFPTQSKALLEIIPGTDHMIVDHELPRKINKILCDISRKHCLQLNKVDNEALCKKLLPMSIKSWCTQKSGAGWKWLPGESSMPPQSWLDALWKWIAEEKVQLSSLEGLPIIPQLADDIHREDGVTLIEIRNVVNMCRLSSLFTTKQRTLIQSIMKKLNFIIVDEEKMNKCSRMNGHPDFDDFIPEISPHSDPLINFLNKLDLNSRVQAIQKLDNNEKDLLRQLPSNLEETCIISYQSCLRSIPVYHAAGGNGHFMPLGVVGGKDEAFLLPDNIPPLPKYPKNLLSPTTSPEERDFLKTLEVKQLSLSDLCALHLMPLALEHIQLSPQSWSVGDDLVVWILKQKHQLPDDTLDSLSQHDIILTRNSTRKKPQEVYDPQDSTFTLLFDVATDKDYFPITNYFEDTHCKTALLTMGMMTWQKIQDDYNQMFSLLCDRMKSMSRLKSDAQIKRGQFIIQTLAESTNLELQQSTALNSIPFLKAEVCPQSYPSDLREKWFGQGDKLYSIKELCCQDDNSHSLIGTVLPILSNKYSLDMDDITKKGLARDNLVFQSVTEEAVLKQLQNLHSVPINSEDVANAELIAMSAYKFLHGKQCGTKLTRIWWRDIPGPLSSKIFILDLPENFQGSLEPFYYHLRGPIREYAQIFDLHDPLSPSDAAQVVERMSEQAEGKLTEQQTSLCNSILIWLYEKNYKEVNVLMPTEDCTLLPSHECVFDDREWMKHSNSRDHIMSKSLTFVHDQIPQKVAKHFKVVPLSSKVAPSQQLRVTYTKAGQHEDITQRIRHIVQDYETNIDIFKELIQNADDAGASEVKFLIDWRHHPTDTLFSKDLEVWQGPALIVYNDATFSDEDFKDILKVGGETKKSDPLKTGRFGIGFCATYHLTDLPSFISRKYFTVFDPHTSYLGERINAQAPGMRIDIVQNQDDLKFYEDQFKPYDSIFGCKVFNLSSDGYDGTLFRFPFRCQRTSKESKICSTIYEENTVSALVQALKEQSNELLLFLKNITEVSVHQLKQGCLTSAVEELFSIKRSGDLVARIKLISTCKGQNFTADKKSSSTFKIDIQDGSKTTSHTWLLSSAIQPHKSDEQLQGQPEAEGLLRLAEVALQIDSSKDNLKILPNSDSNPSKVFCFLPLPIQCKLPFHVNGFFSIGKDRRSVTATDDKTFRSLWNKSLAEGALVTAFVHMLEFLQGEYERRSLSDSKTRELFLNQFYSLWNMSGTSGLIDDSLIAAFKKRAPTLTSRLLWSEKLGGVWLPPVKVCVFKDSKLTHKEGDARDSIQQVIVKDAISLLQEKHDIVVIPDDIYEILKESLNNSSRVFDYKRVCEGFLFPSIKKLDSNVRDRNIKFLIECFGAYSGTGLGDCYDWAEPFLKHKPCISCQESKKLRSACELIDPTNDHFSNLFGIKEGRFPCKDLQDSPMAMQGLKKLGMSSTRLSLADLIGRAQSIDSLSEHVELHDTALKRSMQLCAYIDSHSMSHDCSDNVNEEELKKLCDIEFLPATQKEDIIDVPWCGEATEFYAPSKMFSQEWRYLIFSQHPIMNGTINVLKYLGIDSREPTVDEVIANLKRVIDDTNCPPDKATIKFIDDSMQEIYSFLQDAVNCSESSEGLVETLLTLDKFIWQNGQFLRPSQVAFEWKHDCVPYLCKLSSSLSQRFSDLMTKVRVIKCVSAKILVQLLKNIATYYGHLTPVPQNILEFVLHISSKLYEQLEIENRRHDEYETIYLPDEIKCMHPVAHLTENVSYEWITKLPNYEKFIDSGDKKHVHNAIPHEHAKKLGVKSLLHAKSEVYKDKKFLSVTDYSQHEDICDRLNGILKKYPADESIFKEFIQNADDAQATEIIFVLDRRKNFPDNSLLSPRSEWKSLQHTPALCIYNNRKFTEEDIKGITKLGRGGKDKSVGMIGKFGIGFNVAYHVTDCPSFVSYSENETPEHLCVFDPTQSFVANKLSHGQKWDFKSADDSAGFSDQFKPYIIDDLLHLKKKASSCSEDSKSNGHVVFRLPLTRYYNSPGSKDEVQPSLSVGKRFTLDNIHDLLQTFSSFSHDMLLFLNHLKCVSAFEFKEDGLLTRHFTTTASIPSPYKEKYTTFSENLNKFESQTNQRIQRVSITHKLEITTIQSDNSCHRAEWLIQRVIGGDELPNELLQDGLSRGLRPVGGVATLLKPPTADHKYHLFCFLPLPIESDLPVHVNGHFLVDDSRKHLDHVGLSKWNKVLAQMVIVPAYVDLLIAVKDLIDINNPNDVEFYYSLFPNDSKTIAELAIVREFYAELVQRNPPVFVREVPDHGSVAPSWMDVKSSLFCVPYECRNKQTSLRISDELHRALVALGLPITTAPGFIYDECVKVESTFSSSAAVQPIKITDHLQSLKYTPEQEEVIRKNIVQLLQYCIAGFDSKSLENVLSNSLYLLAQDGSLQRGYLFKSRFLTLLPHCSKYFVDKSLEDSEIGEQLIKCEVIRSLPVEFVLKNVNLPKKENSCSICECDSDTIRLLWEYFIDCSSSQKAQTKESERVPYQLKKYFSAKAIIPASDGKFYPVCLSKTLVRASSSSCDNCCVMNRLGYPSIDFQKIEMSSKNQPPTNIINDLTSCFQAGEDIIHCFKLRSPQTANIELTDDETLVLSFTASLGRAPVSDLQSVSRYLLEMPLFHTIDGSTITLQGVRKVFILTSSDIPLDGIPASRNGQVVLRPVSPGSMKNFYDGVIPKAILTYISAEEAYLQLILPILPEISEESIKAHVDYLFVKRDQMKYAFDRLKDTPFIKHNGKFYKASDLCDPYKEFYKTFKPDNILPSSWHDKVDVLKNLGLQSEVSPEEWLKQAENFSKDSTNDQLQERSKVLLDELVIISETHLCGEDLRKFLEKVAGIEFLYSPPNWKLSTLFPEEMCYSERTRHRYLVKFKGSVILSDANLACLCRTVLPESCHKLIYNHKLKDDLLIENPVSAATTTENLQCLCKIISTPSARKQVCNSQTFGDIIKISEAHYAHLSSKTLPQTFVSKLQDTMCIPTSNRQPLYLVKPSQLVLHLPSECFLQPYYFRVEPWLQKHMDFLKAVGIKEELKAQDYIKILLEIKQGSKDTCNDKDSKVIECAYKELICRLTHSDSADTGYVYLPDKSLNLTNVTELCLNDIPEYNFTLPTDCGFKMILPPSTDDIRHQQTLISILKVKRLSEIVTEELKESCKSSDFACIEEELFKIGKRSESGRCVFVKTILDTLRLDELMHLIEQENSSSESLQISVGKLNQVHIHCLVGELKSVLIVNGQPCDVTESGKSKLCHLSNDNGTYTLYIAPHSKKHKGNDVSNAQFFKDVATCISKFVDNEINYEKIAASFDRHYKNTRSQMIPTCGHAVSQKQPSTQMDIQLQNAKAWMEQAKADFIAAKSLLGLSVLSKVETGSLAGENQCKFPALVCSLCHDTVEKCIKGVSYAFCGSTQRSQDLICRNLTSLLDRLKTMPHHPAHLLEPIEECVMTVNRHETRSRFPIYQHPPCAPATIYSLEDAQEAIQATSQLLGLLQKEDKLKPLLQDLSQLPPLRFLSILQSISDKQGMSMARYYQAFDVWYMYLLRVICFALNNYVTQDCIRHL